MRNSIIKFAPGIAMAIALWTLPRLADSSVLAQSFASAGLAAVHALVAVGVGLAVMHLVRCEERSPIAEGGVALFLGIGALGVVTLLVGLVMVGETAIRVAMTLLAVGLSPVLWRWGSRFTSDGSESTTCRTPMRTRLMSAPALAVVTAIGLLLFLHASLPPLAYDVLEYHLAVPSQWLAAGQIAPVAGNFFSHQPFTAEMNFLVDLALGGDELPSIPKWLNLFGLLGLLAVALGWCKAKGIDRSMRSLAAALVITTPLVFKVSTDALVDIWVILGVICTLHMWHRWILTRRGGALVVAAVCLGLLTTIKHPATVIWVAPLLVLCVWTLIWHRVSPHEWIMSFGALTVFAAIPGLPWLVKEFVWTGNPFFPLAYGLFGGEGWSDAQNQLLVGGHGLRSPLSAEFWTDVWERRHVLGPCPLSLFAGSVLFAWRRHRRGVVGSTLGAVVLSYLVWNMLGQSADRFIAPATVVLAVFGVGGLETAVAWTRLRVGANREALGYLVLLFPLQEVVFGVSLMSWFVPLVIILVGLTLLALLRRDSILHTLPVIIPAALIGSLIIIGEFQSHENPRTRAEYILGRRSWGELTRGMPHLGAHRYLNRIVQPEGAVLLVYESRSFTLDAPVVMGTVFDGQALREFVAGASDLDEVFERMRAAGISHVMVNPYEGERLLNTYFGGIASSGGGPLAPLDALWNFPAPLSDADMSRVAEFLRWTNSDGPGRLGRVKVSALPDPS